MPGIPATGQITLNLQFKLALSATKDTTLNLHANLHAPVVELAHLTNDFDQCRQFHTLIILIPAVLDGSWGAVPKK